MIGSINAADGGKQKPLLRMILQNCMCDRRWQNSPRDDQIWQGGTDTSAHFTCWSMQRFTAISKSTCAQPGLKASPLYLLICLGSVSSTWSISQHVSTKSHNISVFNQLLIIKVSSRTTDLSPRASRMASAVTEQHMIDASRSVPVSEAEQR